ncbi:MAG: serine/threonine-protein kinase [Polyangiaceae bacterium]
MAIRLGRYEMLDTIASGGMATVYLGRSLGEGGFERLLAIKVMHPHIAEDEDFRGMFLDEARLAAKIRHPNVVAVTDVQRADNQLFLVMDYVDGPSLHELRKAFRKRNQPIPVGIALRIFVDTLSGLHAAHELEENGRPLNLVHRDVSPQNILIGRDGVTRITDFGVARAEARITSTRGSQLKGKIAYMPPEQLRGEPLDRRADVYAAACSLWEALVGRRLFRAESEAALVHLILQGQIPRPRELNPAISEQLEYVCLRALASAPEARYESASAFADALETAAKVSGIDVATRREVSNFLRDVPELERNQEAETEPSVTERLSQLPAAIVTGPTGPSKSGTTTNAVVAEVPWPTGELRPPSRAPWIAAIAGAMLMGAAMTYLLVGTSAPAPPVAAPRDGDAAHAAGVDERTAEAEVDEPEAVEAAEVSEVAEEEEPDPTPAASTSEQESPRKPAPRMPVTRKPPPKKEPAPKVPSGPGYNPTEL